MKVAILQCDQVLDKFKPQFGDYADMIRHMFVTIEDKLEFDVYDCQQGDYPQHTGVYDFYITTGSKASAYDDKPWIRQLVQFVRQLYEHQRKLIGICFGHQIMALALSGQVEKSDKGWGVGVASNCIISNPLWMTESVSNLHIIVSHQDQVTQLPNGAEVIAHSDFCPYFMVQWNNYFLSIQGHPEFNAAYSKALMNNRRDIIPAETIDAGIKSLTIEPDNDRFTRWVIDFVKS